VINKPWEATSRPRCGWCVLFTANGTVYGANEMRCMSVDENRYLWLAALHFESVYSITCHRISWIIHQRWWFMNVFQHIKRNWQWIVVYAWLGKDCGKSGSFLFKQEQVWVQILCEGVEILRGTQAFAAIKIRPRRRTKFISSYMSPRKKKNQLNTK
jgi:hypothetical protein